MNPFVKLLKEMIYEGLENFGKFYSKYRAFVVDNEDPEGWGRVRLVIPGISPNPTDYWAWATNQFSGQGYGMKLTPPKGAMVWVEFEQGDPNKPIWSHGHFGEPDEVPKELKDPNIFWFKTPKGHIVSINDNTGEISFTNANGDSISSSEKGISQKTKGKLWLGDKEKGEESAALGNATADILAEHNKGILGSLKNISGGLDSTLGFFKKAAAATTPIGAAGLFISEGPALVKSLSSASEETKKISDTISGLTKKIPGVKSTKVIIEK